MDCMLDRPTCKRTMMERRGAYKKENCPLSEKPKCMLKKDQCPMLPDNCNCALDKVIDIIKQGGCFAGQTPQGCCCCCAQQEESKPIAECRIDKVVALPPCTRCRKGIDAPTAPIDPPKAEPKEVERPKATKIKPKKKKKKKYDKKMQKSLTVPDCTLSSRRPYPCCDCLLKRLKCPITNEEYDSSLVYCCARENKCPFTQVIDMCDSDCDCFDVCPIYTGLPCPFLPQRIEETKIEEIRVEKTLCHCCDPMYSDSCACQDEVRQAKTPKGKCCFCPLIPDPCSLTTPECPVHTGKLQCPLRCGGTCPDFTLPERSERKISCICTQVANNTVYQSKGVSDTQKVPIDSLKLQGPEKDNPEAKKSELVLKFEPSESRLEKMASTNRFNVGEEATVLEKPQPSPSPDQDRLQKSHFVDFKRGRTSRTLRSADFPRFTYSDSVKSLKETKPPQCRKIVSRLSNYPSIANQTLYKTFLHHT